MSERSEWVRTNSGDQGDHVCQENYRHVVLNEGDDCVVKQCVVCFRVRHEPDGRIMVWWVNPPGSDFPVRYASDPPGDRDLPTFWRHVTS